MLCNVSMAALSDITKYYRKTGVQLLPSSYVANILESESLLRINRVSQLVMFLLNELCYQKNPHLYAFVQHAKIQSIKVWCWRTTKILICKKTQRQCLVYSQCFQDHQILVHSLFLEYFNWGTYMQLFDMNQCPFPHSGSVEWWITAYMQGSKTRSKSFQLSKFYKKPA